jgi:hypothetical protein
VEYAAVAPRIEKDPGPLIAVQAGLPVDGQLEPHDVGRVAVLERDPLRVGYHVVGRAHDIVEGADVRAGVAQAGEWRESRHGLIA